MRRLDRRTRNLAMIVVTSCVAQLGFATPSSPSAQSSPTGLPTLSATVRSDAERRPVLAADQSHNAFGIALGRRAEGDFARILAGKRIFVRTWSANGDRSAERAGLGPLYNANSCLACHFKDGRGGVDQSPAPLIYRLDVNAPPTGDNQQWGQQLQEYATSGEAEGFVEVTYRDLTGHYADGEPYRLREPQYKVRRIGSASPVSRAASNDVQRSPVRLSPRIPPTLIAVGLLEAVDATTILEWEDPNDLNGDGISGRARWIEGAGGRELGRFGWRASQPSLDLQVAAALDQDMGIVSEYTGVADRDQEITGKEISAIAEYLRFLAPPAPRTHHPAFARGHAVFQQLGCGNCHRQRLNTPDELSLAAARAGTTLEPYTDLLLHDLGENLADDGIGESGVGRSEWRTAPLWGLGLLETVNGHLQLLHDGRASSFEEAILWHGGEAAESSDLFRKLAQTDRDALVAFLGSI